MGQDDFNKDMDKYIKKRKESDGVTVNFNIRKKAETKKFDEDLEEYGESKGFVSRIFKKTESEELGDDIEQFQELEDELEEIETETDDFTKEEIDQKKVSVMSKFFNFFKSENQESMPDDENMGEDMVLMDEEVKDVLKLALKWIEKLPKTRLREFKTSGDADKFKDVLIRYGIAKDKN
ncbi:MAG: hypothetical protein KKG59_03815 [Nanoarchaeota archaeon]|nr:hypothetical protein [Nanoarchaeota archaeon]